ncbi:Rv1733c family protein [Mycobacterium antarcticum]
MTYPEQAQTRHPVTATVLEDSTAVVDGFGYTVSVQWHTAATEHAESLAWKHLVKAGDRIDIWVDTDGTPVSAPAPASNAGIDAVMAGITIWLSVLAAAAALTVLVRRRLNRLHSADWDRELCSVGERRST